MSLKVIDRYIIYVQGGDFMNSKLYIFGSVTALLLLTGCNKDKMCKEYHKIRAKSSAFIAKEAAADSVRHGLKVARAGSQEVYEAVKDKAKKAKEDVKQAACVVADKAQKISFHAIQKIKNVTHRTHASCTECNDHHSSCADKNTARVVYDKEMHIEKEIEE